MDRNEQLTLAKQYYKNIEKLAEKYSNESKELRGNFLYKTTSSPIFTGVLTVGAYAGLYALFTFVAGVPALLTQYSIPFSMGGSVSFGLGSPVITRQIVKHSNGTLGKNFAKLEMNDYISNIMKKHLSRSYKNILKASKASEISISELNSYVEQTYAFACKFKYYLDKIVAKKIDSRNKEDLQKIQKLCSKINSKNKSAKQKKINKIIEANKKFITPWCEIYNKYGIVSYNFYKSSNKLDPKYLVPDENSFSRDVNYLEKECVNFTTKKMKEQNTLSDMDFDSNFNDSFHNSITKKRETVEKNKTALAVEENSL